MTRILCLLALLLALAFPQTTNADPADIDAAARGVVRVVIIGSSGEEVYPVSHGSGFAVSATKVVTNAHVVREALLDDTLRIGIVPSEGEEAAYGKAVSVSPRNDLALIEITEGSLRLPPLTIAGGAAGDMGEVSSVGYPMNVDRAQGLDIGDIFRAQPPVKSRGFLSGARPSRQFDTILHTAPIARGNSGGPLLDACGRVLGVNSFGADSDGSDAEFYFAVSNRELLPFLRANEVEPRTNSLPCKSIDDLDAAERARLEQQRSDARERLEARENELREKRDRARFEAQLSVMDERENALALALILLMVASAAGYIGWNARQQEESERRAMIGFAVAGLSLVGAIVLWITRPGLEEIDRRVQAATGSENQDGGQNPDSLASEGTLLCSLLPDRSRVTSARTDDVEFDWAADGCVNTRTQYGYLNGDWTRVLVPDDEDAVSVNHYDPKTRTFRTDRYLLGRAAMSQAREARGEYSPPSCGVTDAARTLGEQQSGVLSLLPNRPNERLVYSCEPSPTRRATSSTGDSEE
ncbi:trypsin-like peptidase domain-containing protein [Altererythrobacter arenosus]|uniref:Trypsin-like peptidase domain-containing protein n=1 Tax=Altererythrobacter arenosus TaxID=3032592 RepID=A0ABY8FNS6_9SPHN|nr:trypsin-like peptidase domain-containing protein [Altererythrobacter sp. CAU 1644]WFL76517.1 trypsin-like peptidase domain-containing protein [Altererythrobacter sp. CAU 1644]